MTFQQLQQMVSYILDDLQFGYFTTAQVQFWLNNAQREVQKRLLQTPGNWYMTPVQTVTVMNQSDYVLPADFLKVHRVELVQSGTPPNEQKYTINPITTQQQDMYGPGSGTPDAHYMKLNTLVLCPPPDTSGQVLRIYYSPIVSDMVNPTDIPNIPLQYHEWIGLLAIHDGFLKDGRSPADLLAKMSYYENLLKEDAQQRTIEQSREIVITQGDGIVNVW